MATETTPQTVQGRAELLDDLDHFCQREIWCVSSETRRALAEAGEANASGPHAQLLLNARQLRENGAKERFAKLHQVDKEVVAGLKAGDGSITPAQVFDQYRKVFDACCSRAPDAEEEKALRALAHQACTFLLPVRIAARKVRCALLRSETRTDLPSFEDLQTAVRAKKQTPPPPTDK